MPPLVASPPSTTRTAPPPGSPTSTGPRTARSPPAETKPGPSSAATRLVDGERLDDAVQVERQPGRPAQDQPSSGCPSTTAPLGRAPVGGRSAKSTVVAGVLERGAERRVDEPSERRRASLESGEDGETQRAPASAFTRESSQSGRKRLNAASQRSKTARDGRRVAAGDDDLAAHRAEAVNGEALTRCSSRRAAAARRRDLPALERRSCGRPARTTSARRAASPCPSRGRARASSRRRRRRRRRAGQRAERRPWRCEPAPARARSWSHAATRSAVCPAHESRCEPAGRSM